MSTMAAAMWDVIGDAARGLLITLSSCGPDTVAMLVFRERKLMAELKQWSLVDDTGAITALGAKVVEHHAKLTAGH